MSDVAGAVKPRFVTDAPLNYDGFGTKTVEWTGRMHRGAECRIVECQPEHAVWQLSRYQSGLQLAATVEQWEATEREGFTIAGGIAETGFERVKRFMLEDLAGKFAAGESLAEADAIILAYEGERDGLKYIVEFPLLNDAERCEEERPRVDAIFAEALKLSEGQAPALETAGVRTGAKP